MDAQLVYMAAASASLRFAGGLAHARTHHIVLALLGSDRFTAPLAWTSSSGSCCTSLNSFGSWTMDGSSRALVYTRACAWFAHTRGCTHTALPAGRVHRATFTRFEPRFASCRISGPHAAYTLRASRHVSMHLVALHPQNASVVTSPLALVSGISAAAPQHASLLWHGWVMVHRCLRLAHMVLVALRALVHVNNIPSLPIAGHRFSPGSIGLWFFSTWFLPAGGCPWFLLAPRTLHALRYFAGCLHSRSATRLRACPSFIYIRFAFMVCPLDITPPLRFPVGCHMATFASESG